MSKESYITPELMSELDGILDEKEEDFFDDFTKDLSESAPAVIELGKSKGVAESTEREDYLKERRKHPNVSLPDSVDV